MKIFKTTLTKELNGLRRDFRNPRGSGLVECYNVKTTKWGLRGIEDIRNPVYGVGVEWPYPQIVFGQKYKLMLGRGGVYSIDDSGGDWTYLLLKSVAESHQWTYADYVTYFVLTNGVVLLFVDPNTQAITEHNFSKVPLCNSLCDFKGQLILGGIRSNWYECDKEYVVWSRIGSADCVPDHSNEAGYRHMGIGEVLMVMRLDEDVVVYGTAGVSSLIPTSTPAVTFGVNELAGVGISSVGAVGGMIDKHIFLDEDGELWSIKRGTGVETPGIREALRAEKLGYSEFLSSMVGTDVVITYDEGEDDFYITNGESAFIFNEYGLCEVFQMPTSLLRTSGLVGILDTKSRRDVSITSDVLDFGSRGLKNIAYVEVGVEAELEVYAAVDFRYNMQRPFERSRWTECNKEGFATINVAGTDFRLCLRCDRYVNFKLDYVSVHYQYTDRRFVGGFDAAKIVA